MSIVQADLPGARVLDLFAGSGALGLEALSRGAASADFVEIAPKSVAALLANARDLGAGDRAILHRMDALTFISRLGAHEFDVAFADPPYRLGLAQRIADAWRQLPFARVIGIEHDRDVRLEAGDRRAYGDPVVSIYRVP